MPNPRDLRESLRLLVHECGEKEDVWKQAMEHEHRKLVELHSAEVNEMKSQIKSISSRAAEVEKEKSVYFDMIMSNTEGRKHTMTDLQVLMDNKVPLLISNSLI